MGNILLKQLGVQLERQYEPEDLDMQGRALYVSRVRGNTSLSSLSFGWIYNPEISVLLLRTSRLN